MIRRLYGHLKDQSKLEFRCFKENKEKIMKDIDDL